VAENTQVKELWRDALSGKISRREIMRRGVALGLGTSVLAALAQEGVRSAMAQERSPIATFYDWMIDLHPGAKSFAESEGIEVNVASTANFSSDVFVLEAQQQKSTWDFYAGVTPFLEMKGLVNAGAIEPWDAYLPAGAKEDLIPATVEEGSIDGQFYVWPWLLDVISIGWNAELAEKAGIDPEVAPTNWDEFIANAQKVKDSGAAPFGLTFDFHDWRSLIPITHSISTDVYVPETGLLRYTADPVVQALEILKQFMPLANTDVLNPGQTDGGVNQTPDELAFAGRQTAYYVKYANAFLRFASQWPDPSKLRVAALPTAVGGEGGTVFWDSGIVLLKYGQNKEKAADFVFKLSQNQDVWRNSIAGNPDEGTIPVGQLPTLQSTYSDWEATPPDFVAANQWIYSVYGALPKAKAIAPTVLSVTQFDVARPQWIKYLSGETADAKTALQAAQDAVAAEYTKVTGEDPGY
jgi:ABC-type glycerol-3-phosphate transport system substrate-binding protein